MMLLFAVAYCCNLNSQCELNDPELFTGDYMVTQVTPGIFGPYLDTFDPDGGGVILTLYSEVTDSSQDSPDVSIASNQRSFDAVYLPEAGIGQGPRSFLLAFSSECHVTFPIEDVISNNTGLICSGSNSIHVGFAVGGDYNTSDDSTFTVYFRDDYYNSCDRPITYTELRFDKVNFGADDTLDVPVSIYPNPSEEFIQIEIPITITIASIELYDIQGKRLDVDISDNYQMDVSQLRSGMYVVHINTTNGALTKTVVKR